MSNNIKQVFPQAEYMTAAEALLFGELIVGFSLTASIKDILNASIPLEMILVIYGSGDPTPSVIVECEQQYRERGWDDEHFRLAKLLYEQGKLQQAVVQTSQGFVAGINWLPQSRVVLDNMS